jgi:uncharacterized membrane protein YdjX (TVP38/TMEM64 family)
MVGLIGLGLLAAWISPERVIGIAEKLMRIIRGLGARGAVIFAIVQVLVAVSGVLPASLLGVAAGAIYGVVPGFLLAAASTLAGALFSFFLSRSLFRASVERSGSHLGRKTISNSKAIKAGRNICGHVNLEMASAQHTSRERHDPLFDRCDSTMILGNFVS